MNKEKEIEAHSKKPFEIGDSINVSIPYQLEQSPSKKRNFAPIQRDCVFYGQNLTVTGVMIDEDGSTRLKVDGFRTNIPHEVYRILNGISGHWVPAKYCTHNVDHIGAQLPENADDRTTIASFLMLNFSGVPLSREHLEYVQSIKF